MDNPGFLRFGDPGEFTRLLNRLRKTTQPVHKLLFFCSSTAPDAPPSGLIYGFLAHLPAFRYLLDEVLPIEFADLMAQPLRLVLAEIREEGFVHRVCTPLDSLPV